MHLSGGGEKLLFLCIYFCLSDVRVLAVEPVLLFSWETILIIFAVSQLTACLVYLAVLNADKLVFIL